MNKSQRIICGAVLGAVAITIIGASCRSIPKDATAVKPFDADRYLGKWYEIARFDFKFERGLSQVTANYSRNPDGSIRVVNRGFKTATKEWKEAIGKAKFRSGPDEAKLKVSFWGPFYSGYNVIALDSAYRYALVAGKNLDYLWLLSRETSMPGPVIEDYLKQASSIGYDTSRLVWVDHRAP